MGQLRIGMVGQYVLPALESALHSIDIISPWLSPEYAQRLVAKAKDGVRVRVVTSDDYANQRHQQAVQILNVGVYTRTIDKRIWYYLVAALVIAFVGALTGGAIAFLALFVTVGVIVMGAAKNIHKHRTDGCPLFVRVTPASSRHKDRFVHVKLYIVDKRIAFAGSANLTRSGMSREGEQIEVKTEPGEVQQEIQLFEHFWGSEERTEEPTIRWRNKPVFRDISR